jgi:plastocyanin
MKTHIGLFILGVLLVAASGCTSQPATPGETATNLATPVSVTEVATTVITPLPTTVPASVSTTAKAAGVTTNITTVATTRPIMTPSTKVTTIHIRNNTFVPAELTVLPGTGITWINDDSGTHLVKATGDSKGKFTSTDLISGAQFRYTFGETTGTYEFGDPKYPDMKGAIIVKKAETLWVSTFAPAVTTA